MSPSPLLPGPLTIANTLRAVTRRTDQIAAALSWSWIAPERAVAKARPYLEPLQRDTENLLAYAAAHDVPEAAALIGTLRQDVAEIADRLGSDPDRSQARRGAKELKRWIAHSSGAVDRAVSAFRDADVDLPSNKLVDDIRSIEDAQDTWTTSRLPRLLSMEAISSGRRAELKSAVAHVKAHPGFHDTTQRDSWAPHRISDVLDGIVKELSAPYLHAPPVVSVDSLAEVLPSDLRHVAADLAPRVRKPDGQRLLDLLRQLPREIGDRTRTLQGYVRNLPDASDLDTTAPALAERYLSDQLVAAAEGDADLSGIIIRRSLHLLAEDEDESDVLPYVLRDIDQLLAARHDSDPELATLVRSTRDTIATNIARIEGTYGGPDRGAFQHPDYAEVGKIRSVMDFLYPAPVS